MSDVSDFIVFDSFFGGGASGGGNGNPGCGCLIKLLIAFVLLFLLGLLTEWMSG